MRFLMGLVAFAFTILLSLLSNCNAQRRETNACPAVGCPEGVVCEEVDNYSLASIKIDGIGEVSKGRHYQNVFEVDERHVTLSDGTVGVQFNVETVPAAQRKHRDKPNVSRKKALAVAREEAALFYDKGGEYCKGKFSSDTVRVEAASRTPNDLAFAGGSGFFAACITAFAQHLPLALSPDHVWSIIAYAFAKHVDENAEEIRDNFVDFDGKKRLLVETRASFRMGNVDDPDSGASPEEWEQEIFPEFSEQIREYIGDDTHGVIANDFSTTSASSRAAHEIALMSAMKNYFSYGISTSCGIPRITLLGLEEDWIDLKSRAQDLGSLMMPEFSDMWMPLLMPVLDEFIESYRGNVNHGFWQTMVKLRHNGQMSGYRKFISGWLQILFPYLSDGKINRRLKPWQETYFSGPEPEEIPTIRSSAPVDWKYWGETYNLHFHAGIIGYTQDTTDGTLTPTMGWYVTHEPPQDLKKRLKTVKKEMKDLLKGHQDEANAKPIDETQPWFKRLTDLRAEQALLEEKIRSGETCGKVTSSRVSASSSSDTGREAQHGGGARGPKSADVMLTDCEQKFNEDENLRTTEFSDYVMAVSTNQIMALAESRGWDVSRLEDTMLDSDGELIPEYADNFPEYTSLPTDLRQPFVRYACRYYRTYNQRLGRYCNDENKYDKLDAAPKTLRIPFSDVGQKKKRRQVTILCQRFVQYNEEVIDTLVEYYRESGLLKDASSDR